MLTIERWNKWLDLELENYKIETDPDTGTRRRRFLKKGYLHFDPKIWLPERKDEFKNLILNSKKISSRAFYPFVRTLVKTPRYRVNEKSGKRALEHKIRPICYASHSDSLIYSFYGYCLNEKYQEYIKKIKIDKSVLAYRTDLHKSNIEFSNEVFDIIRKKKKRCTAIALDIKGFFDNINHGILKEQWLSLLGEDRLSEDQYKIYKSLCNYAYVNKNTLLRYLKLDLKKTIPKPKFFIDPSASNFRILRDRNIIVTNDNLYGIPQGSPMSGVLSNIYLIGFDRYMLKLSNKMNFSYFRYCDDILIVCDSPKANIIAHMACAKIEAYKLKIQIQKQDKITFRRIGNRMMAFDSDKINKHRYVSPPPKRRLELRKKLQYLGFEFDGESSFIRSSTLSRYYRRMNARIDLTLRMAYGNRGKHKKIFIKKLLYRNTHIGENNFISYASRAGDDGNFKVNRQIRRHDRKLYALIIRKNRDFAFQNKKMIKAI